MFYLVTAVTNHTSSTRFVHSFDDLEYARLCMESNLRAAGSAQMTAALISIDRKLSAGERVELRNALPLDAVVIRSTNPPGPLHRLSKCHLASVRRDVMDLPVRVGNTRGLAAV